MFWFRIWSDTNQAVQPQKMARSLKFWIWEVEGLCYPCSENKGSDQLRDQITAKLICVFVFVYAKCWFSHDTAHLSIILRNLILHGVNCAADQCLWFCYLDSTMPPYLKCQASSHLLWLFSSFCLSELVGNPKDRVSRNLAHLRKPIFWVSKLVRYKLACSAAITI